ncbi:MAG: hypothetical protein AAGN66_06075 [Acidobacteriota bacterium]
MTPKTSQPHPKISRWLPLAVAVLLVGLAGCAEKAPPPSEPEPEPVRVENAGVGVALASLPAFFRVDVNEGDRFVLVPADPQVAGELTIVAQDPQTAGINLLAAVEEHKAQLGEAADGEFKGQRELNGPLGTAFYSRGRYTAEDGTATEEIKVFLIHPWGDRRLDLSYVYPAGDDTAQRLQDQLFEVFGELEPLEVPGEDAAADTPAESG